MIDYVVKLSLDINCAKNQPVINAAQFDKGRKIEITVTADGNEYDISECTAVLRGVRSNKTHFALSCEIADNKVIVETDEDTLSTGGVSVAKLVLSDSTRVYSTQMLLIDTDDALEGNVTKSDSYSILIDLIEQVKALQSTGSSGSGMTLTQVQALLADYAKSSELDNKEDVSNRVTSITQAFTDESGIKYPTVLALLKYLEDYYYNFEDIYAAFDGIRIDDGNLIVLLPDGEEKSLGSVKGEKGDTGANGSDYILTDDDMTEIVDTVKAEVPLVKSAEQPTFVNSVDEMTDSTKVYLMSDGYLYGYKESENHNLFKISEVSYSSRLQDDAEEIVSSTTANAVTGWIPVKYGKYYALSVLYSGTLEDYIGKRVTSYYPSANPEQLSFIRRINIKKADGTVTVYGSSYPSYIEQTILSDGSVITFTDTDITAVQIHIYINGNDISTDSNLAAYEPMFVSGNTAQEAYNNAVNLEYIDGDVEVASEWYNTGLAYNQPADYEDRVVVLEEGVSELKADFDALAANITNPVSASPYFRDVNFGVLPFTYYQGVADAYEKIFDQATTYATFIEAWKSLITNHSGYVTETELGAASDGQSVYLYDFKPARISNQNKPNPKIIIIAGQHGFEKSNVYGLYYFVDNLLNRWNKHPSLEYLRNHVELMIVPFLNTYGFDNLTYVNGNGVNLNRNYDSNWGLLDDTTSVQYGGAEPFDQPETQIVRDLLDSNTDALLVVDFHTNGQSSVAEYDDINYYGVCSSTDDYYNRMIDAVAHNLSAISGNFNLDYGLGQPDTIMGFLTQSAGTGLLRGWATDNNFIGVLVEGFNGFPNDAAFTGNVYKANEEIIVNYLITALNYLAK